MCKKVCHSKKRVCVSQMSALLTKSTASITNNVLFINRHYCCRTFAYVWHSLFGEHSPSILWGVVLVALRFPIRLQNKCESLYLHLSDFTYFDCSLSNSSLSITHIGQKPLGRKDTYSLLSSSITHKMDSVEQSGIGALFSNVKLSSLREYFLAYFLRTPLSGLFQEHNILP